MTVIYCPTCNRSSEEIRFIGTFCESCILEKLKRKMPNRAIIHTCRFCDRIAIGNDFAEQNNKSFSRALNIYLHIKDCNVKVRSFEDKVAHCEMICEVEGTGDFARFPYDIAIKEEHKTCTNCYRRSSGYFEAVIQIRGDPKKAERVISNLTKFSENRGAFIGKIEPMDKGSDVYMSDKMVANEFFSKFKLKPKRSYTLYGLVRGKEAYRNIYSLRLE